MRGYDQWKLATPPEYDEDGPGPDEPEPERPRRRLVQLAPKLIRWPLPPHAANAWVFVRGGRDPRTGRLARVVGLTSTKKIDMVEFVFGGETEIRKVEACRFVEDFRRPVDE